MGIATKQIKKQIENATKVTLFFIDAEPESILFYNQDGVTWIKPLFSEVKQIPVYVYKSLTKQFEDTQRYITDSEIIHTKMGYDSFFEKYYNQF